MPVVTLKAGPGGVFDQAFAETMTMRNHIRKGEKAAELVKFIESERAEIERRTGRYPRRGQALRLHMRPGQLGDNESPDDRAKLHSL